MSDSRAPDKDGVFILPPDNIGRNFIPSRYLPKGRDEYYLRETQQPKPGRKWRGLRESEKEILIKNGNACENWDLIKVTSRFDPTRIKNSGFFGLVRIGMLEKSTLQHHDLRVPSGITNSRIIACDIGDNTAIHNVHYLANYIIGDRCILFSIDEMHATDRAKFGNGIIKQGEPENTREWMDLINETSARAVLPFDGMTPGDAFLWAKFRDNGKFIRKLGDITQNTFDTRRGFYGTVNDNCVIKSCRIIKDVKIGSNCIIDGASRISNVTVNSNPHERTRIGAGVNLANGIVGAGCRAVSGSMANHFVLGRAVTLELGACIVHSCIGDNSTVACAEIRNSLIFPGHEQHHRNSFLIAALVQGQSNIAAGATLGSNHNSRANDGEVQAGRGFWPGLSTTIKYSSRFASFTLLAKGNYPAELDITLPFSLVSNNESKDCLHIIPAYWWMYNMYALERNTWKFATRDKRAVKTQHIEFDALAPDTVEEIIHARDLLEQYTGESYLRSKGKTAGLTSVKKLGRELLIGDDNRLDGVEILGRDTEKGARKTILLKVKEGFRAYGDMIRYYAVKNLLAFLESRKASFAGMTKALSGTRQSPWMNIGGQLVPEQDVLKLISDVCNNRIKSWHDVHKRYDELWAGYPLAKQRHSLACLCALEGTVGITKKQWLNILDDTIRIADFVRDQVYLSRKKDYQNKFRQTTFRNKKEMAAVAGDVEKNAFIKQVRAETAQLKKRIALIKKKI